MVRTSTIVKLPFQVQFQLPQWWCMVAQEPTIYQLSLPSKQRRRREVTGQATREYLLLLSLPRMYLLKERTAKEGYHCRIDMEPLLQWVTEDSMVLLWEMNMAILSPHRRHPMEQEVEAETRRKIRNSEIHIQVQVDLGEEVDPQAATEEEEGQAILVVEEGIHRDVVDMELLVAVGLAWWGRWLQLVWLVGQWWEVEEVDLQVILMDTALKMVDEYHPRGEHIHPQAAIRMDSMEEDGQMDRELRDTTMEYHL
jgi:hypothetical protein